MHVGVDTVRHGAVICNVTTLWDPKGAAAAVTP